MGGDPFGRGMGPPGPPGPPGGPGGARPFVIQEMHIDPKVKIKDLIPEWDGSKKTILEWIRELNYVSELSNSVYDNLPRHIPFSLKGEAKSWFQSLQLHVRRAMQVNWGEFKNAILDHFLDAAHLHYLQGKAIEARYRQRKHSDERPIEYFYRKLDLLQLTSVMTEVEYVVTIIAGMPSNWKVILGTYDLTTLQELQNVVREREYDLLSIPEPRSLERRLLALESKSSGGNRYKSKTNAIEQRKFKKWNNNKPTRRRKFNRFRKDKPKANAIGFHKDINPTHAKDDNTVSTGKTPKDKGARPCRHCGSLMHWDNDCKYSKLEKRKTKVNLAEVDQDYVLAYFAYNNAYNARNEEDEESSEEEAEVNVSNAQETSESSEEEKTSSDEEESEDEEASSEDFQ
jgi:hypothetical protein